MIVSEKLKFGTRYLEFLEMQNFRSVIRKIEMHHIHYNATGFLDEIRVILFVYILCLNIKKNQISIKIKSIIRSLFHGCALNIKLLLKLN